MKKCLILIMFLTVCMSVFADDGFFMSAGIFSWGSPLEVEYKVVEPNNYPLVDNAIPYTGDDANKPITMGLFLSGGYKYKDFRFFIKTGLSMVGAGKLYTQGGTSATYSASDGSTSSHSANDGIVGKFNEFEATLNAGYDFLFSEDKFNGFGAFVELGAGIAWVFGESCKFLDAGSFASSYDAGSDPDVSYDDALVYNLVIRPVVPLIEGQLGLRYYFNEQHAMTLSFGLNYYVINRIPENTFYFQDEDGNAVKFSLLSDYVVPSIIIGYNFNI